jgi:hypothetical protein
LRTTFVDDSGINATDTLLPLRRRVAPPKLAKAYSPNHYFPPNARRNPSRCFMSLTLYAHPFSTYCQTVLVALYENDVEFEYRTLEDPSAMVEARRALDLAYGWLEQRLAGRTWAAGENPSLADCAAAPSLFSAPLILRGPSCEPRGALCSGRLDR